MQVGSIADIQELTLTRLKDNASSSRGTSGLQGDAYEAHLSFFRDSCRMDDIY